MELHWDKFQVLAVRSRGNISAPDGTPLKQVQHLQYLGAHLSAEADMGHELGRRIGEAKRNFTTLRKVWSHSSLTWPRKLRIYSSIVESKLLYGLAGSCLTKSELRRLDGFQNRCVRQIIGVRPSWISRVSNIDVLTRANHALASRQLLCKQMSLFGHVLQADSGHPPRTCTFAAGSLTPLTAASTRRVGRPHKEFAVDMTRVSQRIFGSTIAAQHAARHSQHNFEQSVRSFL